MCCSAHSLRDLNDAKKLIESTKRTKDKYYVWDTLLSSLRCLTPVGCPDTNDDLRALKFHSSSETVFFSGGGASLTDLQHEDEIIHRLVPVEEVVLRRSLVLLIVFQLLDDVGVLQQAQQNLL